MRRPFSVIQGGYKRTRVARDDEGTAVTEDGDGRTTEASTSRRGNEPCDHGPNRQPAGRPTGNRLAVTDGADGGGLAGGDGALRAGGPGSRQGDGAARRRRLVSISDCGSARRRDIGGAAKAATPWRDLDPFVIDLEAEGMEMTDEHVGALILFDHNEDGFETPTGWALPDDPPLVYEPDGSGSIDSAAELFAAPTVLPEGANAPEGIRTVSRNDTNGDGESS